MRHVVQRLFHALDQKLDLSEHLIEHDYQLVQFAACIIARNPGIETRGIDNGSCNEAEVVNWPQGPICEERSARQADDHHGNDRGEKRIAKVLENFITVLDTLAYLQQSIVAKAGRCDLQ